MYFGQHLLLDAFGCSHIEDKEVIRTFLLQSIDLAGMTLINGPHVFEYLQIKDLLDSGVTGVAVISESHLSLHSFRRNNFITADLYSCAPFDAERIVNYFKGTFNPAKVTYQVILRGEGFKD